MCGCVEGSTHQDVVEVCGRCIQRATLLGRAFVATSSAVGPGRVRLRVRQHLPIFFFVCVCLFLVAVCSEPDARNSTTKTTVRVGGAVAIGYSSTARFPCHSRRGQHSLLWEQELTEEPSAVCRFMHACTLIKTALDLKACSNQKPGA